MGESEMKMDEQHHAGSPIVRNEDKKSDITDAGADSDNVKMTIEEEVMNENETEVENEVMEEQVEDVVNGDEADVNKLEQRDLRCDEVIDTPEQELPAGDQSNEVESGKQIDEQQEELSNDVGSNDMAGDFKFHEEEVIQGEEIEDGGKSSEENLENLEETTATTVVEQNNVEGGEYSDDGTEVEPIEFNFKGVTEEEVEDNEQNQDSATGSILEDVLKNGTNENSSLNKLNNMEEAREGCDSAPPSSPGHADQRSELPPRETDSPCEDPDAVHMQTQETNFVKLEDDTDDTDKSPKRKSQEDDDDIDEPAKKLKKEIQQETYLRNKILMEYTEALDTSSIENYQQEEDKLFDEIQNLEEIAKEKEREWNNIIHIKKMKEELLLRIQRQKQVCMIANGLDLSISETDQRGNKQGHSLAKSLQQHNLDMNGHDPKGRNKGPVRNVQSIIADYRQRHPETVPRRGRRIRNVNGSNSNNDNCIIINNNNNGKSTSFNSNTGTLTFANMALGSGAQVRPVDSNNEIALLLSSMENVNSDIMVQKDLQELSNSYKEYLDLIEHSERKKTTTFAKQHQQQPPPLTSQYPEVTVHAVTSSSASSNAPTNSLLHGILTKTQVKTESRTTFSPTLARLLTAPDKTHTAPGNQPNKSSSNVSISDILSTNKTRSEITITPVTNDYDDGRSKRKHQVEEETEDSVDRLVIDESTDLGDSRTDNNSDTGDDVPQCQGCNQKAAQFVCAGCGNQWYCSRECQVTAWDEHSDVCSG